MRCRACNVPLTWRDFKMLQEDGSEENMCASCLSVIYNIDTCLPKYYQFEEITEIHYASSVTREKPVDY